MIQRERVTEWRITSFNFYVLKVRYWIEDDPEHGGIATEKEAHKAVKAVETAIEIANKGVTLSPGSLAEKLMAGLPSANSIEVTDLYENGVAVHRDWP